MKGSSKTYYEVLGVKEDASIEELNTRFRQLAITYHPQKNVDRMASANYKFTQICEAYEVLSKPELREVYDRYGETTLKNGYPTAEGLQSYRFSGDPMECFEEFFGNANPHTIALDGSGKQVKMIEKIKADLHSEAVTERVDTHTADLVVTVPCTLDEFFYGSTKDITFKRNLVFPDGKSKYFDTRAKKTIEVKPGMKEG